MEARELTRFRAQRQHQPFTDALKGAFGMSKMKEGSVAAFELQSALGQFYGSLTFYKHWLGNERIIYSEGVHYLAEHGGRNGAHWLLDAIVSHLISPVFKAACHKVPDLLELSFWQLDTDLEASPRTAVLTCRVDSNKPEIVRQEIGYTDFNLAEIQIWVGRNERDGFTMYLPSEH